MSQDFDKRFSDEEIEFMREHNIKPELANQFENINGFEIASLVSNLSESGIYKPMVEELVPEINRYPKGFYSEDIEVFLHNHIIPEKVAEYIGERNPRDLDIDGYSLSSLILGEVPLETALEWWPHFKGWGNHIATAVKKGISLEKALEYPPEYLLAERINLKEHGISAEKTRMYANRWAHIELTPEEKEDREIRHYHYFRDGEIILLEEVDVPMETIRAYDSIFFEMNRHHPLTVLANADEIALIYDSKITPEMLESFTEKSDDFIDSFNKLRLSLHNKGLGKTFVVGTGTGAIVAFDKENKTAKKFCPDPAREYGLLKKVEAANGGNPQNVVKAPKRYIFDTYDNDTVSKIFEQKSDEQYLELEYIEGETLDAVMRREPALPPSQVLQYCQGILNGLIEMRNAGIYSHRDIRPGNVIIEQGIGRAVIIDLGLATEKKDALPEHNRRFGSSECAPANDLVSLGQVMYYLALGNHIFAKSESMSRTFSDIADEINDYRTMVYLDPSNRMLNSHLQQVDETILNSEGVREIIKACLTSSPDDHEKIMEMFKEYAG